MTEFEQIYQAYFGDVYRYLKRLTGDENLAQELTSETFFKAMQSIDRFRGDCEVQIWLCRIAKNCFYSEIKKNRRLTDLEQASGQAAQDDSVEEELMRQGDALQIYQILHQLSEPYKEVFQLRVLGELSFSQIANLFGKTENWACVTFHRARNKIREKMEESCHET